MNMSSGYFKEIGNNNEMKKEITTAVEERGNKEEIDYLGGLLHTSWKPELKLHRIGTEILFY